MTLHEYLRRMPEPVPSWLDDFTNGDAFGRQQIFASRIVYYPGSGTDGHPVKLFGSTHCAHSFVYADYAMIQATIEAELEDAVRRFRGYHTLVRLHLFEGDWFLEGGLLMLVLVTWRRTGTDSPPRLPSDSSKFWNGTRGSMTTTGLGVSCR